MNNVFIYISKILNENKIIDSKDEEVFKYGLEGFITAVLEILSVLIVSAILGNFINTIIFFIAFLPLRLYAGGYHAETRLNCYLVLLFVYYCFILLTNYIANSYITVFEICSLVLTVITVMLASPIINANKKASKKEISFYREKSIKIMIIENIVILAGIFIVPRNTMFFSFSLGQLAVTLSMVVAIVKNRIKKGGGANEKI